ncbi:hypothetical protein E4T38_06362 [Aureobasidium subglaciale]|nr:hypothetical protein E4T38_06362 [Aureobasidium subglaciale]
MSLRMSDIRNFTTETDTFGLASLEYPAQDSAANPDMAPSTPSACTFSSLPNELLIEVFKVAPTIQSAVSLSATSRLLHAVWLRNNNCITRSIANSTIPATAEAIDYAILETDCREQLDINGTPPPHLWLPNLVHIADLCASAHALYQSPEDDVTLHPGKSSYYMVRLCLLAFEFPELRDKLHDRLLAASPRKLREYVGITYSIMLYQDKEEADRQGSLQYRCRLPNVVYPLPEFSPDRWLYTEQVLMSAQHDLRSGYTELPAAIDGYMIS